MRKLIIFLLLACLANAEEWRFGRSVLSDGKRMEMFRTAGKIPSALYPPALWCEFNYNDSTVVYDLSGNNNTGTVSGATWVADTTGGYYSFDGNDSIDCGNDTSLQITNSMTLSAWVKTTDTTHYQAIISKLGGARGYELQCDMRAGNTHIVLYVASDATTLVRRCSAATNMYDGVWRHVVGVYDSVNQTMDIYINAVLCNGTLSGTVPASQYIPSLNTKIGIRPNADASSTFIGSIDDTRIFNRALSSTEVTNLFAGDRKCAKY